MNVRTPYTCVQGHVFRVGKCVRQPSSFVLTVYSRTDAYTCVSARVNVPSTALDRAPLQLLAVGLTLFFFKFYIFAK